MFLVKRTGKGRSVAALRSTAYCRGVRRFFHSASERLTSNGSFDSACIANRSEEHTSELQSLMRISYAVFCLNKTNRVAHMPYSIETAIFRIPTHTASLSNRQLIAFH